MFLTEAEVKLTDEYLKNGYIIRDVDDISSLDWIQANVARHAREQLQLHEELSHIDLLNRMHEFVSVQELNQFRLRIIEGMNAPAEMRPAYFNCARSYLNSLVGNELAMQLRVNLSIQLPNDDSSLLPVHADTWSGDSPFEVVVWIPLVDCYKTKSMYILPPQEARNLSKDFRERSGKSSEDLYQSIKDEVHWINIKYGQVLVFNQGLPHGNRVNAESETRWSMNCRFKGAFTPYADKKIGEFFEPITLRAASRDGLEYSFPRVKS